MSDFISLDFPASCFSDPELEAVLEVAELWLAKGQLPLAFLIGQMAEAEITRREHNRSHTGEHRPPIEGQIDADAWSDSDIADSLEFLWHASDVTRSARFGELLDAIGTTFVALAADRLRSSNDPRNATSFEERNGNDTTTDE